ncbi:integrin-linked protein kinase 1-like [Olea europaea var. sylvestris]|uniref:integrin-linked protein kinase 1-like n=1 Tax=Olea europaea var. sylvestris TaxID=158386 RepID=UPI000C1D0F06|nr:integrin-linked protein kinase 1-like [Olea europaea var. sylvestris]
MTLLDCSCIPLKLYKTRTPSVCEVVSVNHISAHFSLILMEAEGPHSPTSKIANGPCSLRSLHDWIILLLGSYIKHFRFCKVLMVLLVPMTMILISLMMTLSRAHPFVNAQLTVQFASSQKIEWEVPYRLLFSSSKCDKDGVILELEKGVETNQADYDKRTALHLASCEGCTEIVHLLLEKGADVNIRDRWGRTPLSDARSFGHEDICKILEAHGGIDPVGLETPAPCCEIPHTEVDMRKAIRIGEGAYGEVYLVKWRGTEVAAKTIRSSVASNPMVRDKFLQEMGLWQRLRHPNIVEYLGVLDLKHSDRIIFLAEYLQNGSLYDILRKKGRLDLLTAVSYALDIARYELSSSA